MKYFRFVILFVIINILAACSSSKHERLENISQLKSGKWEIGYCEGQASIYFVLKKYPNVKLHSYFELFGGFESVRTGKIDGFAYDRLQMQMAIDEGFKGVKLLDDNLSEPVDIAVGISPKTNIPNLENKINEYIRLIKSDGTLDEIDRRWFGSNKTTPDIPTVKQPQLHLVVGTTGIVPPYSYYQGTALIGSDIEIARRFAAYIGADVSFKVYNYDSIIVAAQSGEIDCIMANLNITDERRERIGFSEPLYSVFYTIMVRDYDDVAKNESGAKSAKNKPDDMIVSLEQLNAKGVTIGMGSGANFEIVCRKTFPNAEIQFYETYTDMAELVKLGKLTAIAADSPTADVLCHEIAGIRQIEQSLETVDYAVAFPKTQSGEILRNEFNDFLTEITKDGTLAVLQSVWFGADEDQKTLDVLPNTGKNGTINLAVDVTNPPFIYMAGTQPVGYEIAVMTEFCRRRGYGLNIISTSFTSLIPGLISQRYDCAIGGMSVTEERKQSVHFSEPTYKGATVLIVKSSGDTHSDKAAAKNAEHSDIKNDNIPSQFAGKTLKYASVEEMAQNKNLVIGMHNGFVMVEKLTRQMLPNAKIEYYKTNTDLAYMTVRGKIDGFINDEPVIRYASLEVPGLAYIRCGLDPMNIVVCFPKNDKGASLRDEFNTFLRKCKKNGTIERLDKVWFGSDESKKIIDLKNIPAKRGTLHIATEAECPPFEYIKDGKIVGYEIDLIARFCREAGYGLDIQNVPFDSLIMGLESGIYDFVASFLSETPAHKDAAHVSEPIYESELVMAVQMLNSQNDKSAVKNNRQRSFTSARQLNNKKVKIGIMTGANFGNVANTDFPKAKKLYYNNFVDMAEMVAEGQLDAMITGTINARMLKKHIPTITYLKDELFHADCSFGFTKNERGKKLCDQMNVFLAKAAADGRLDKWLDKWLGDDESVKTVDYENLSAPNGIVSLVTIATNEPLEYRKGKKIVGYEIECMTEFCKEFGYGLKISDANFDALLAALAAGTYDCGASMLLPLEERRESMYFSIPDIKEIVVAVIRKPNDDKSAEDVKGSFTSLNDLNRSGIRIGLPSGSTFDVIADKKFPKAEKLYFNDFSDVVNAVRQGKADLALLDEPVAIDICRSINELTYIHKYAETTNFGIGFAKSAQAGKYSKEFDSFLSGAYADGTMKHLRAKWIDGDESGKTLSELPILPNRPTFKLITHSTYAPFSYMKDNKLIGYDIELICRFCQKMGYNLDIMCCDSSAVVSALVSGKGDAICGGVSITPERKQSIFFSQPTFKTGVVAVVKKNLSEQSIQNAKTAAKNDKQSVLSSLASSFEKTFVRESRWKLILSGIWITIVISIMSALLGTALGFGICGLRMSGNKLLNGTALVYIRIMQGMPMVVLLMILFYIVFAKSGLSGAAVAIIGFGMNFGAYVSEMIRTGILAVDKGQMEAALALGYTKPHAFVKIILPQAAKHFLPVFQGEFISLVKMTSVVGYIAIQDLTKAGDIIRSRTYEAFFPLITIAVIYFVIAWLLTRVLVVLQNAVNPRRKK